MKKLMRNRSQLVAKLLVLILVVTFLGPVTKTEAVGNFTLAKDTLSNSRPSVVTTTGAVSVGNTSFTLGTTVGIQAGDVLTFAQGTPETLTVATVIDGTHLATTTAAANTHSAASAVYDKQTSVHTFTFTTRSTVASGSFLITFPGTPAAGDNIPDSGQFDFNSLVLGDVSASGFTAGTVVVTSSAATVSVPFSSSIAASTAITITVGSTNKLLNPTKTAASGTADIWAVKVDEKDATGVIDTSSVDIGTIEATVVSVSVSPSLTFTIAGISTGATAFGATNTNATTTPTTVPFGSISAGSAQYAAQLLSVTTNAVSGYDVTTYQDGALRKTNGTAITTFSTTAADNNSNDGFGYTMANVTNTDSSFLYNTSGTFYSSGFGTSGSPTNVMTNAGPVTNSQSRVIYRVRVPGTQAPGDYTNLVTYIASPKY